VRLVVESDIPTLRALLKSTASINAHVAGALDAAGWEPDFLRTIGIWLSDDLVGVIVNGRVLRIAVAQLPAEASTLPQVLESVHQVILDEVRDRGDVLAVMGTAEVVQGAHLRPINGLRRDFQIWEKAADGTTGSLVQVPSPAQIRSFARASYAAFGEEIGRAPAPCPDDPAYLQYWERARNAGRILGQWDEHGECVFRVEIRPILGMLAELRGLWLHPRLRGTGIAPALLDDTVSYVGVGVASRVQVICDVRNPAAEGLYRGAGFTVIGRLSRIDLPTVALDHR